MIKVNSKVKMNMPRISQLTIAQAAALAQTAEALHTEVVQAGVVPRMDGALQGEKMFVDASGVKGGVVSIVHEGPYARRLYFHPEYHFHTEPWEETIRHKDGRVSHLTHEGNPNAKAHWFEDWQEGGKYESFAVKAFGELYRRLAGL